MRAVRMTHPGSCSTHTRATRATSPRSAVWHGIWQTHAQHSSLVLCRSYARLFFHQEECLPCVPLFLNQRVAQDREAHRRHPFLHVAKLVLEVFYPIPRVHHHLRLRNASGILQEGAHRLAHVSVGTSECLPCGC
eukprot:5215792-Prymnesium_polylepis.2